MTNERPSSFGNTLEGMTNERPSSFGNTLEGMTNERPSSFGNTLEGMKLKLLALIIFCAVTICGCIECEAKDTAIDPNNTTKIKATQSSIAWVYTLAEGLTLAQTVKKPLMVDFFATWCGWCKKLDKDVYTNAEVAALSKEFICVKVDTDKYGKDTSKYVVMGLPTIAFLNVDGTVIDKIVGYAAAPDFAARMKKVLKK